LVLIQRFSNIGEELQCQLFAFLVNLRQVNDLCALRFGHCDVDVEGCGGGFSPSQMFVVLDYFFRAGVDKISSIFSPISGRLGPLVFAKFEKGLLRIQSWRLLVILFDDVLASQTKFREHSES
jgi:hypothetical protein